MQKQTILFQTSKAMLERENIVKEIIKCCESLDLNRLEQIIKNASTFQYNNIPAFIVEIKIRFNIIKRQGITMLTASEEFINLCFFKQEIVHFSSTDPKVQFTLMFDTDGGFIKDITIC